jgi:hypothetical protein
MRVIKRSVVATAIALVTATAFAEAPRVVLRRRYHTGGYGSFLKLTTSTIIGDQSPAV